MELTPEMKRPYIDMGNRDMIQHMCKIYKLEESESELLKRKIEFYLEVARKDTRPFPKMVQLVKRLQEHGIPLAVASGSGMAIIEELLIRTGLRDAFSVIFSSELVEHSKPAPDVFLECAKRMGIESRHLAVVEDSIHGVEAGVRAGMRVLAVPGFPDSSLDLTFHMANWLVEEGMEGFDEAQALGWLMG